MKSRNYNKKIMNKLFPIVLALLCFGFSKTLFSIDVVQKPKYQEEKYLKLIDKELNKWKNIQDLQ